MASRFCYAQTKHFIIMKKVYMFLATIVMAATMSAETITLKMSDYATTSFTTRGITVTATDGTQSPASATGEELRVYAGGTLTIATSANNITAISFELSSKGQERLATLTSDVPTLAEEGTQEGGQAVSWAGKATSITLTVGDKADFGTTPTKAGQFDLLSITITTDGEQPADPEPTTENITFAGGQIDAEYGDYGFAYLMLYTFEKWTETEDGLIPVGDGTMMEFLLYIGDYKDLSDTYSSDNEMIDIEESYMAIVAGTDTTQLTFTSAELTLKLVSRESGEEEGFFITTYDVTFSGKASNGIVYTARQTIEFETFEPVDDTAIEQTENAQAPAVKCIENGNIIIIRNGVKYNLTGSITK